MPRPGTFVLRRPAQVAALGSAVRSEIVSALAVHGPCSVREIAARIGRRPETLYYHVRTLVDVGVVVLKGKRKARRRAEAVYRLVAPRLTLDRTQRSRAYTRSVTGACAALLRLAAREYQLALERGIYALRGPQRNLAARRCAVRLTDAGLSRFNRLLERLLAQLERDNRNDADQTYAFTIVLTPLPERTLS